MYPRQLTTSSPHSITTPYLSLSILFILIYPVLFVLTVTVDPIRSRLRAHVRHYMPLCRLPSCHAVSPRGPAIVYQLSAAPFHIHKPKTNAKAIAYRKFIKQFDDWTNIEPLLRQSPCFLRYI